MKFQSHSLGNNGLFKSVTSFTVSQITSALNGQSKDCTRYLGLKPSIGTFFIDSDVLCVYREYFLKLERKFVAEYLFLISNFCHVLNVVCFLLGNTPVSEFYVLTFPKRWHIKFRRRGIIQKKAHNRVSFVCTHNFKWSQSPSLFMMRIRSGQYLCKNQTYYNLFSFMNL
jgi:hypothetical protein